MLQVHQLRGGHVETVHPIAAAIADSSGVRASFGGDFACFWRSSSKAMQLTTSLEQLPADVVATLTARELAIGAASHGATPEHVALVESLLARFGRSVADLRCGAHWPSHEPSARALATVGEATAIHNNCSGKHTFMAAATWARGWDPDYRPADHPLQRRNAARVEEWCNCHAPSATDGCGVPTFHVPVDAMARAFARLAMEMKTDALAGRIGRAMAEEPELVSSPGEGDATLVRALAEPAAAKRGAEGLLCVALPERGLGVAVKAHSGAMPAAEVAMRAILDTIDPALAGEWRSGAVVTNVVGAIVGERRAIW